MSHLLGCVWVHALNVHLRPPDPLIQSDWFAGFLPNPYWWAYAPMCTIQGPISLLITAHSHNTAYTHFSACFIHFNHSCIAYLIYIAFYLFLLHLIFTKLGLSCYFASSFYFGILLYKQEFRLYSRFQCNSFMHFQLYHFCIFIYYYVIYFYCTDFRMYMQA